MSKMEEPRVTQPTQNDNGRSISATSQYFPQSLSDSNPFLFRFPSCIDQAIVPLLRFESRRNPTWYVSIKNTITSKTDLMSTQVELICRQWTYMCFGGNEFEFRCPPTLLDIDSSYSANGSERKLPRNVFSFRARTCVPTTQGWVH